MENDIEKAIIGDMYKLLKHYGNVPKKGTPGADDYWKRFSDDLIVYGQRYDNHPLTIECGCAVWCYCERIGGYRNEIGDEIK